MLGRGGMGVVYRATQLSLGRVVALKLLAAELSEDPGFRARFQREAKLQAALEHEHIVPVYEAGQTDDGLFMAMRLIDGPTLKDLILEGQLDPRRSLRILAQVAQALDAAHDAGLIHRDIKPQNILIEQGDRVYLADFGLIKAPDEARLTDTGQFIGTIDYVSPEQIQGEPATAASDTYALAAVLYECLTGQVPFLRANEAAVIHAHVVQPPPRVTELCPDLPPAIDEVIGAGMAKDPPARPASAVAMIRQAVLALALGPQTAGGAQVTRLTPLPEMPDTGDASRGEGAIATVASAGAPGENALAAPDASTVPAAVATKPAASPSPLAEPATADGAAASSVTVERRATRPSRLGPIALVAVLAVAAIVVGFLVGNSGSSSNAPSFTNSATVGPIQLRYPAGWQVGAALPAIPGISFTTPVVLGRSPGGAGLTAGVVAAAAGPTLLAPAFRSKVTGALPTPAPVKLGAVEAYRYSGLQVAGLPGTVTLYAAPTSAGTVTLACWSSSAAASTFQTDCGEVAATLRLLGATAYPLGPSAAYGHQLSATLDRLRTDTTGPLAALGAAKTPAAQATAARQLAAAYAAAAHSLRGTTVSPLLRDAQSAIVASLTRLSGAYTQAAAAAKSSSTTAYNRAGQAVDSASATLGGALRSLRGLGYTLTAG
ncbi:MAG: protein kinase domain-containing protein [Solirubrobacteraceae bacterium]